MIRKFSILSRTLLEHALRWFACITRDQLPSVKVNKVGRYNIKTRVFDLIEISSQVSSKKYIPFTDVHVGCWERCYCSIVN